MKFEEHPTVRHFRSRLTTVVSERKEPLDVAWLKQLALNASADDVNFVEIGRPALDDQRDDILKAFPRTKALVIPCGNVSNPLVAPGVSLFADSKRGR
ncbi:MAG: hypothetical protein WKF77_19375 [Planctomycetaceae bacterium]